MSSARSQLSLTDAPALIAQYGAGGRVFLPGGPIEPVALARAFSDQPEHARKLTFCGMMIPGINTFDWAALDRDAQAELFLPSAHVAATIKTGQTRILPLHYSSAYKYLSEMEFKVAVFHVCAPDSLGLCNLSLSNDSCAPFMDRDVFKLAIINHGLPFIAGAPYVPLALFDAVVETNEPPIEIIGAPSSPDSEAIANHIAGLVDDGSVLQAGIGKLPAAVMAALRGHKNLKVHSGLLGDWAMELMKSGAIEEAPEALVAGVILGSPSLHAALRHEPRLALKPIGYTHDHQNMANLNRFTSINAALEIDLMGQINCEYAGHKAIGGIGGALDFLRGARASTGGKPIIMIASEGKDGTSRIVERLTTPSVSIGRSDPPILVTEYGAIDLERLDTAARAQAIMSLAAPKHRDSLSAAWRSRPS
jgi:acyl-CoA hydrolase